MSDQYASGIEHTGKYVAYYRVSTLKQGATGLGMDAQRETVTQWINGGNWEMIGEFVEVESGKKNDRPQLAAAIALCKKKKATLVVAKLDRLGRNLAFIANLMESKINLVVADQPAVNNFTLHILAAVAEQERIDISKRTKAALAALKKKGVTKAGKKIDRLGQQNDAILRDMGHNGHATQSAIAQQFADNTLPIIEQIQAAGLKTLREIATALHARGIKTSTGRADWHPQQVKSILDRKG
jgi:DNA invertase Pin-like site-specific DNA recombinase